METLRYKRQLPIDDTFDIVVVGGGPSGVAAAITAGRMGRRVALIEQLGCLGGIGTSGLVNVFMPFGDGHRPLMQGIGLEFVRALYAHGFLPGSASPKTNPRIWEDGLRRYVGFNAEGLKLLMDEWVEKANVEIRFFNTLIDVVAGKNQVETIVLSGKERLYAMRARYFVDATGDATVTAMAGLPCQVGDEEGNTQAPTLCSMLSNIDLERYERFRRETRKPDDWQNLQAPLEQAIDDGVFTVPDHHLPGIFVCGDGYGILNAGHIYGVDCLKDEDMTQGMIRGRKLAQEYLTFYRNYVAGCEDVTHMATAAILGVRETRRVVGEYVLNIDDFLARRSFDDEIGRYNYPVDVHRSTSSREEYEQLKEEITKGYRLPDGESYGIPYRSLIPKGARNLLVSGRCISTDRLVHGSVRVMPGCLITGQAAGAAAALCCERDIAAKELDAEHLRHALRAQGAYIP